MTNHRLLVAIFALLAASGFIALCVAWEISRRDPIDRLASGVAVAESEQAQPRASFVGGAMVCACGALSVPVALLACTSVILDCFFPTVDE